MKGGFNNGILVDDGKQDGPAHHEGRPQLNHVVSGLRQGRTVKEDVGKGALMVETARQSESES